MAQSVSECIFFTSKKTSFWILSTQVKASCVWTRACNLSAVGEWRWGFPSLLMANLAPASVRDPASKKYSGDWQSRTPNILLWPLHSHILAHTCVHTRHTCTRPKESKDSTLVKTKPSKLFRGKGRGFNCGPFIVSHQSKTFLKITPHSEMDFSSDEILCFHNLPDVGSHSSFFTDQAAQLYILGWIQSGTWTCSVVLETCSFWWSLTECHVWIRQPRQRGACSNPINVKIYGLP